MTEAQRDVEVEKCNQYRFGAEARRAELQAEIIQEQCRTLTNVLEETRVKTQNAQMKAVLAQGQGARIQMAIQTTAAQLQGDQHKLGMAQDQAQFLGSQRGLQAGLYGQNLQALNLQLTETTARNEHQSNLLNLQGWTGNSLPSAAGFERSAASMRPIRGLRRTW